MEDPYCYVSVGSCWIYAHWFEANVGRQKKEHLGMVQNLQLSSHTH